MKITNIKRYANILSLKKEQELQLSLIDQLGEQIEKTDKKNSFYLKDLDNNFNMFSLNEPLLVSSKQKDSKKSFLGIKDKYLKPRFILNKMDKTLLSTEIKGDILEKQDSCFFNNYHNSTQNLVNKDNWAKKLIIHFFEGSIKKPRLISTPQFKHTNNKLEILIYVYNHKIKKQSELSKDNIKKLLDLMVKIYDKPVKIRQINLKSPQLNVEIFVKYLVRLSLIKKQSILSIFNKYIKKNFRTYVVLKNDIKEKQTNKKALNFFQDNLIFIEYLSLLNYGHNIGIKIETAGRSSKRRKAARSSNMVRTKGSLKNCYSSKGNIRQLPLYGYKPLGIEKAYLLTKTKNGSFNHKLTIASY